MCLLLLYHSSNWMLKKNCMLHESSRLVLFSVIVGKLVYTHCLHTDNKDTWPQMKSMKDNQVFSVDSSSSPESKQAPATQHALDESNAFEAPTVVSGLIQEKDRVLENKASLPSPSSKALITFAESTHESDDPSFEQPKSMSLDSKVRDTNSLEEARSSSENTSPNSDDDDLGPIPFSGALSLCEAIPYSGPIAYSGSIAHSGPVLYSRNISKRSNGSSARSFAFPVLPYEWNSSPTRMPPADRRFFGRRSRSWLCCLCCCKRSSTLH